MKSLFHASSAKNLQIIHPRKTLSRDKYIGDYVFATSDFKLAVMYLTTKGVGTLMNYKSNTPTVVICSNAQEYLLNDHGGAIYTVPAESFHKSPQEGLEESEMVSTKAVRPTTKMVYEHSIDAMQDTGVAIYFVNEAMFDKLIKAKDESKIISKLKPYNK